MKFISVILAVSSLLTAEARANFRSTCNTVSSQMVNLQYSIGQIKQVADTLGHTQIASKCDQASNQLAGAQTSWGGISSGFLTNPWQAGDSPHGSHVKSGMSQCGASLSWMWNRPELRHPMYHPHISSCQNNYNWCDSGCQSIWNWPSPPGYKPPRPSQGYSGYGRRVKRSSSVCPHKESACPISADSEGFECLDTHTEVSSCGGCVTRGKGENCLLIPGAEGVGCLKGKCVVLSLKPGFVKNESGRPIRA